MFEVPATAQLLDVDEPSPANASSTTAPPRGLADALAIKDPLARAAHAQAWIERATIEDFRKLAEDPDAFPAPEPRAGFEQECRRALHDALFDRWFRLDPEAALAAVHRLDDAWRKANRSTGELLTAVARVRPKLVLESQLKDEGISYLSRPVEVALETLAAKDAPAARKFLLQIEEPAVRCSAEIVISFQTRGSRLGDIGCKGCPGRP